MVTKFQTFKTTTKKNNRTILLYCLSEVIQVSWSLKMPSCFKKRHSRHVFSLTVACSSWEGIHAHVHMRTHTIQSLLSSSRRGGLTRGPGLDLGTLDPRVQFTWIVWTQAFCARAHFTNRARVHSKRWSRARFMCTHEMWEQPCPNKEVGCYVTRLLSLSNHDTAVDLHAHEKGARKY